MPGMNLEETLYTIGEGFLKSFDRPETVEFLKIMIGEGLKRSSVHKDFMEYMNEKSEASRVFKIFSSKLSKKLEPNQIHMYVFQFIGTIFNYAIHSKLNKTRMPFEGGEKEYLRLLAKIYAQRL
jgi:hypothetical protein